MYKHHQPVMLDEVKSLFNLAPLHNSGKIISKACNLTNKKIIDATLGYGGHTRILMEMGYKVLAIESDKKTMEITKKDFQEYIDSKRLIIVHDNFSHMDKISKEYNFYPVQGVFFDLGINSTQIEDRERGISFQNEDAVLDMRTDDELQVKGSDLLNLLSEKQLSTMFLNVCSYNEANRLSKATVSYRERQCITTVGDFLKIIKSAGIKSKKINAATKPFLALRMAVNSEIENIVETLPKAFELLISGGRLVVISFHSTEDSKVKDFFTEKVKSDQARVIGNGFMSPTSSEVEANPRSRSAKLRCIEKI